MNTLVVATLQVEGTHRWEDCPFDEVGYLRDAHRHMFHIKVVKEVTHDDRDVEIIKLKRQVKGYLEVKYHIPPYFLCDFGCMSCEMIAKELVERFDLESCEVLEDGENGAIVRRN